jgi:hypothetical protein
MPAPNPKQGESQKDYLDRCVPFFVKEGRSSKQSVAICSSIFNRSTRKSDPAVNINWDKLE